MKRLLTALALCLLAPAAFSQTLTFTVETSTANGQTITPRLTWSATPSSASCTASGATDWTGTKPATGTALLAAISATRSYSLTCNWPGQETVLVEWAAPSTNTDGSPLTNLAGYRVQYGTATDNLDKSALINDPATLAWRSGVLAAGDWWFTVRAFNTLGLEGPPFAPPVKRTLAASASQTRTLEVAVKFPSAPTALTVR